MSIHTHETNSDTQIFVNAKKKKSCNEEYQCKLRYFVHVSNVKYALCAFWFWVWHWKDCMGEKKDHTKFSVPHTKVVLPTCKRITLTLRESIHKVKVKMSPETYPATVRIIITLHPIRIDVFHIYSSFY